MLRSIVLGQRVARRGQQDSRVVFSSSYDALAIENPRTRWRADMTEREREEKCARRPKEAKRTRERAHIWKWVGFEWKMTAKQKQILFPVSTKNNRRKKNTPKRKKPIQLNGLIVRIASDRCACSTTENSQHLIICICFSSFHFSTFEFFFFFFFVVSLHVFFCVDASLCVWVCRCSSHFNSINRPDLIMNRKQPCLSGERDGEITQYYFIFDRKSVLS